MAYRTLQRKDSISSRWLEVTRRASDEGRPSSTQPIVLPTASAYQSPGHVAAQAVQLQSSFPHLSRDEIVRLVNKFHSIPTMTPGRITKSAAINALQSNDVSYDRARETLKGVRADATGTLDLEDWIEFASRAQTHSPPTLSAGKRQGTVLLRNPEGDASHTIDDDERAEFTNYINTVLAGDPDIGNRLPLPTDTMQIFDECRDGLIICKLIEQNFPGTISRALRSSGSSRTKLNVPSARRHLNKFQIAENNNIAVLAARAIGCSVVNIGGQDIAEGREHLILGLIWQVIRIGLLKKVDLKWHPELFRLCGRGEKLDALRSLPPDQILLRWVNFHLAAAGSTRRVANFHRDLVDGECYLVLMHQLKPHLCSLDGLSRPDTRSRAEAVLRGAERLGCRRYITLRSLMTGNPRLNLAFVANLFNVHPGLDPPTPQAVTPAPTRNDNRILTASPTPMEDEPLDYVNHNGVPFPRVQPDYTGNPKFDSPFLTPQHTQGNSVPATTLKQYQQQQKDLYSRQPRTQNSYVPSNSRVRSPSPVRHQPAQSSYMPSNNRVRSPSPVRHQPVQNSYIPSNTRVRSPSPVRHQSQNYSQRQRQPQPETESTTVMNAATEFGNIDADAERDRIMDLQLNSSFMERGTYSLFEDLKGGIIILQALDKVAPGTVMWCPMPKPKPSHLRSTPTGNTTMSPQVTGNGAPGPRRALLFTRTANGGIKF